MKRIRKLSNDYPNEMVQEEWVRMNKKTSNQSQLLVVLIMFRIEEDQSFN